ncbi:Hypothetical_protein [Hexamita inflata]|uniref:Hypothetical_protein n=1 Tax=Hexamita inflata TaxID=28002 RepID=A0AA86RLJ2_9EUKA|nr:Hypothetical protein HINF_LOCUS64436 [Hexamita inflata]
MSISIHHDFINTLLLNHNYYFVHSKTNQDSFKPVLSPKTRIQPLRFSTEELSQVVVAPYTYSAKSDSVGFTKWQTLTQSCNQCLSLIEKINTYNYQLKVQLRRAEYLQKCNAKNKKVVETLKKNQFYFTTQSIKQSLFERNNK